MTAYLDQMSGSLPPASIAAVSLAIRGFDVHVTSEHQLRSVHRRHKRTQDLARQPARRATKTMSAQTVKHRLGMLHVFFDPISGWGWTDAPKSCPILTIDIRWR